MLISPSPYGPSKGSQRERGEERETRASSWEARGFLLAAAQQAAGTHLPLKLLSNDWLLPITGFANNNQVKISNLNAKLCLKDRECCPVGVREEGMLGKGRWENILEVGNVFCIRAELQDTIQHTFSSLPLLRDCQMPLWWQQGWAGCQSRRTGDMCTWGRERKRHTEMEI